MEIWLQQIKDIEKMPAVLTDDELTEIEHDKD